MQIYISGVYKLYSKHIVITNPVSTDLKSKLIMRCYNTFNFFSEA